MTLHPSTSLLLTPLPEAVPATAPIFLVTGDAAADSAACDLRIRYRACDGANSVIPSDVHICKFQIPDESAAAADVAEQALIIRRWFIDVKAGDGLMISVQFASKRIAGIAYRCPTPIIAAANRGKIYIRCELVILAVILYVPCIYQISKGL